jgi:hypothetical protein
VAGCRSHGRRQLRLLQLQLQRRAAVSRLRLLQAWLLLWLLLLACVHPPPLHLPPAAHARLLRHDKLAAGWRAPLLLHLRGHLLHLRRHLQQLPRRCHA